MQGESSEKRRGKSPEGRAADPFFLFVAAATAYQRRNITVYMLWFGPPISLFSFQKKRSDLTFRWIDQPYRVGNLAARFLLRPDLPSFIASEIC